MNSIVRALNNIAISLGRIADALNNKSVLNSYTSNATTSTSVDNKVAITSYQVKDSVDNYKNPWKPKQFEKHNHDYISQTIQELSSKDHRDILLIRLRNIVINNNISNPLVVNPKVHEKIMQKHRQEWPSLWLVIDEIINDSKKIK
jgi:hypothetical protein